MFSNHLRYYYAEVFTTIFVAVGILLLSHDKRLLAWPLIILGVVNTPATIVGFAAVVVRYTIRNKRWRYFLLILVAAILALTELYLRRGNPFLTGYENDHGTNTFLPYSGLPGFSYPLFFGVISILFSFGKGIIFFAPGLLLPSFKSSKFQNRELRECYIMWLYFLGGMLVVYSKWWAWYGGWFWGPRYFLFASIPASMALAVHLHQTSNSLVGKLVSVGILTLSSWVGINGAVFGTQGLEIWASKDGLAHEFLCWYVPEFSVLWRPFVVPKYLRLDNFFIVCCFALIYLYLSLPFYYKIGLQSFEQMRYFRSKFISAKEWRF
jgi:hypothetical protein